MKLNGPITPGGDIYEFLISADSSRVIYRADQDTNDLFELYSIPIGGGILVKLNDLITPGGDVEAFQISPNSLRVIYNADQDTNNMFELYSVPIGGGTPLKLNGPITPGGDVYGNFELSSDNAFTVFRADQDTKDVFELYISYLPLTVDTTIPAPNSVSTELDTHPTVVYNLPFTNSSVTDQSLTVHRPQDGSQTGPVTIINDKTFSLTLTNTLRPGELVQVTVRDTVQNDYGISAPPYVWQFYTKVLTGSGTFATHQEIGATRVADVALGDLDGDGDPDAFAINDQLTGGSSSKNQIYRNDNGQFYTAQNIDGESGTAVALGDLDGDGDLDAFVVNGEEQADEIWLNKNSNSGEFELGQRLDDYSYSGSDIALADFDGDGDLDAVVANMDGASNQIYTNNGGFFSQKQPLNALSSHSVAVGDLDLDGDIDVLFGNDNGVVDLWLNDGKANFVPGINIDMGYNAQAIALADFDGDYDLDIFFANGDTLDQPNQVWINEEGTFSQNEFDLGPANNHISEDLSIGDVDADGDLDLVEATAFGNVVWQNDGLGNFSGLEINTSSSAVALADIDGDSALDIYGGSFQDIADTILLNQSFTSIPKRDHNLYLPILFKGPAPTITPIWITSINTGGICRVAITDRDGKLVGQCGGAVDDPEILPDNHTTLCAQISLPPHDTAYQVEVYPALCPPKKGDFYEAVGIPRFRGVKCIRRENKPRCPK